MSNRIWCTQHGADAGAAELSPMAQTFALGAPLLGDCAGVRVSASVWVCWCTGLRSGIMSKGYAISEMHFATNSGGGGEGADVASFGHAENCGYIIQSAHMRRVHRVFGQRQAPRRD